MKKSLFVIFIFNLGCAAGSKISDSFNAYTDCPKDKISVQELAAGQHYSHEAVGCGQKRKYYCFTEWFVPIPICRGQPKYAGKEVTSEELRKIAAVYGEEKISCKKNTELKWVGNKKFKEDKIYSNEYYFHGCGKSTHFICYEDLLNSLEKNCKVID